MPPYTARGKPRERPEKVKDRIVRERGFKTLTRVREDVAEVAYRPTACQESYRLVIVRQTINHLVHHRGQLTVYLRLIDVPVPSIYGPSADEQMPGLSPS